MNRRSMVVSVLAGVAALTATSLTAAYAALRDLSETRRGSGEIVWRTGSDRIDTASVNLRPDGRAEVRLEGRDRHTFAGRWREARAGVVSLDLEGDFGRSRAQGDGVLYLRGGTFDRLDLRGNADNGSFSVRFAAGADSGGFRPRNPSQQGRPPWGNDRYDDRYGRDGRGEWWDDDRYRGRPLAVNQSGTGGVTLDGRRVDSLERVYLDLDRDGTARVRFLGRRDRHTFAGRWEARRGSEDVRVVLDGDFYGERTRLEGTVNLRVRSGGERIDRIDLRGAAGDRRAELRFEAL